jgi:hypothetical protein
MAKFNLPRSPKLDFFYFLIFTILVLIIFAVIILGTYFDYWSRIFKMEQYYQSQSQQ